eukprot:gnl/Trimastix_PCT/1809.p1 GENE.gnl/Trimastix_PCT/1809~~gnl/Trimastix_PCT/1809.p1  ORF type:complete len:544 (-),score=158.95 gnl/Trimastix_PCT/1809:536-2167(-)
MSGRWNREERQESRLRSYRKGCDADTTRRKREEATISIRKNKRDEHLLKKRKQCLDEPIDQFSPQLRQKLDRLPEMLAGLDSADNQVQYDCTRFIRRILSIEKKPPIDLIVSTGVIPKFVHFMTRDDHPKLQFEAAWALTNIASGTSEQTRIVTSGGAVPHFARLLKSPDQDVREQSVWALGNIAGDGSELRKFILRHGNVLQDTLDLINTPGAPDNIVRNATWALSNFCRGNAHAPEFQACLPVLAKLVYSQDEDLLGDACTAISYLSDGSANNIQAIIDLRIARRLVDLLMHPSNSIVIPALRTVGNIVTGNATQTQVVLNCNVLPSLLILLGNQKKTVRKEAMWTISNITAGNQQQIQAVLDHGILPTLIHLLNTDEWDIRKEAAWSLSNATCGSPEQVKFLVANNAIKPLCDLLTVDEPRIVIIALEGIENILKVGEMEAQGNENPYADAIQEHGGVDMVEDLQRHVNPGIYERANQIIVKFFPADEDEEMEDMAPAQTDQGQAVWTVPQVGAQIAQQAFNFGQQPAGQPQFNFGLPQQ